MSGVIGGAGSKSGVIGETELDYEEGTWTVTVGGATASLYNAVGYYTKIGKMVFYRWYSGAITFSSSSGTAFINLPFSHPQITTFSYEHGNAVDGSSRGGYSQGPYAYFIDAGNVSSATFIDGSSKYIMFSLTSTI